MALRKWEKESAGHRRLVDFVGTVAFARNMRMLSAWRNLSVKREVIIKTAFGKRTAGCRFGRPELEHDVYKNDGASEETLSIDAVIRFLRQWKGGLQESSRQYKLLEKNLREKEEELSRLRSENQRLLKEVSEVKTDYHVVNDDYKALIQIMDRARRLAFLNEEDEELKTRFKMDANGNLERIE